VRWLDTAFFCGGLTPQCWMRSKTGPTLYTGHHRELRAEAAKTPSRVRLRPIALDIAWNLWLSVLMARPIRLECEGAVYGVAPRELGYRDGSGVGQVVKRLEREAARDTKL